MRPTIDQPSPARTSSAVRIAKAVGAVLLAATVFAPGVAVITLIVRRWLEHGVEYHPRGYIV